MNDHEDFDRLLTGWFEADALVPAPAGALERTLDATRHRRPRPAWMAGLRSAWVRETQPAGSRSGVLLLPRPRLRWSLALILLLVVAALMGGAILVGARLLQPPPLPGGWLGHLAYVSDGGIYVADWDGRNAVRIADLPPGSDPARCPGDWAEGPMWSPDGRYLAYRSASGDRCDDTVVITNLADKSVESFLATGWRVSWSPDSTRVATWVDEYNTIGIFGVDGGRQALLSVPSGCALAGDFDPRWSPDKLSLLLPGCEIPIDGQAPHQMAATDPRSQRGWSDSPDGARVAYLNGTSLEVAAADGSQPRVLVPAEARSPVWSPAGDRIAFIGGSELSGPSELSVVDVTNGTVAVLATTQGSDSLQVIRFSPEGDLILYATSSDATVGVTSVWSIRADGSDAQLLLTGTGWGDFDWEALLPDP